MSNPASPTIIQGPAIATFQGSSFYFKDSLTVAPQVETFMVGADLHGDIDERLKSISWKISGTPCGAVNEDQLNVLLQIPTVGRSLIETGNESLVIHSINGDKLTYHRACITGLPQLRLRPTETLLGPVEWTAIGKAATQPTDAAYFRTLASASFTDTTFDESEILTARYIATWGASPFNAMTSLNGFTVDFTLGVTPISADDFGVVDLICSGIGAKASFAPASLTQANLDTLGRFQNTGALLPGESFAKGGTNLVIASDVFQITLSKCGPKVPGSKYAVGSHRHDVLEWATKQTWTNGTRNALWTVEVL